MPRSNPQRRRELADAAIELLAAEGLRGLTHRAVDRAAQLPTGTASNYFPSRDQLLVATAERVVALHLEQMVRLDTEVDVSDSADPLVDLISASLQDAVTTSRHRYLAIVELQAEAARRPVLESALSGLAGDALGVTLDEHARLDLQLPPEAVGLLVTLYGGALFALIGSAQRPDDATVDQVAAAIVAGVRAVRAPGAGAPRSGGYAGRGDGSRRGALPEPP